MQGVHERRKGVREGSSTSLIAQGGRGSGDRAQSAIDGWGRATGGSRYSRGRLDGEGVTEGVMEGE
jgi:hypothetical protein